VYLAPGGRNDAEAEELGDGDPRHGAAGGPHRDPVAARERLQGEGEERSAPSSSQDSWNMAPWWSRSSTEGGCREDGAEEGSDFEFEGEDGSPPSQASAWSWSSSGIEEESGINPAW